MSKKYDVILASTAQFSIEQQIHFLAGRTPNPLTYAAAYNRVMQLVDQTVDVLSDSPLSCPIAPELTEFGITRYRRMLLGSYRVFYEIDEPKQTVTVVLFIDQAQSVEKALLDYALLGRLP